MSVFRPGEKTLPIHEIELRGLDPEVAAVVRHADALLQGTGYRTIRERPEWAKRIAPWRKPKCPHGCTSFVNGHIHGDAGRPATWECWGCGAILVSTEREVKQGESKDAK